MAERLKAHSQLFDLVEKVKDDPKDADPKDKDATDEEKKAAKAKALKVPEVLEAQEVVKAARSAVKALPEAVAARLVALLGEQFASPHREIVNHPA